MFITFPLQHWLRERASILRYKYVACHVIFLKTTKRRFLVLSLRHLIQQDKPNACSGVPRNFVSRGGGVQQIQLRTEDRDNADLGAVAP